MCSVILQGYAVLNRNSLSYGIVLYADPELRAEKIKLLLSKIFRQNVVVILQYLKTFFVILCAHLIGSHQLVEHGAIPLACTVTARA